MSVISGSLQAILGADAARDSARASASGAAIAAQAYTEGLQAQIGELQRQYDHQFQVIQPMLQTQYAANAQLAQMLGLPQVAAPPPPPPGGAQAPAQTVAPPTDVPSDYRPPPEQVPTTDPIGGDTGRRPNSYRPEGPGYEPPTDLGDLRSERESQPRIANSIRGLASSGDVLAAGPAPAQLPGPAPAQLPGQDAGQPAAAAAPAPAVPGPGASPIRPEIMNRPDVQNRLAIAAGGGGPQIDMRGQARMADPSLRPSVSNTLGGYGPGASGPAPAQPQGQGWQNPNLDNRQLGYGNWRDSDLGRNAINNQIAGLNVDADLAVRRADDVRMAGPSLSEDEIVQDVRSRQRTGDSFEASPGYAFAREEMQRELDRKQSAGGGAFGGRAIMEAQRRATGLANQEYYNWLDRRMSEDRAQDAATYQFSGRQQADVSRGDAAMQNYLGRRTQQIGREDTAVAENMRQQRLDQQIQQQNYENYLARLAQTAGAGGNFVGQAVNAAGQTGNAIGQAYANQGAALGQIWGGNALAQGQINANQMANLAGIAQQQGQTVQSILGAYFGGYF